MVSKKYNICLNKWINFINHKNNYAMTIIFNLQKLPYYKSNIKFYYFMIILTPNFVK